MQAHYHVEGAACAHRCRQTQSRRSSAWRRRIDGGAPSGSTANSSRSASGWASARSSATWARRGRRAPPGQKWATFVRTHAQATWACDFLQVVDVAFRSLFAFVIVERGSRRVIHVGVMRPLTDAWLA